MSFDQAAYQRERRKDPSYREARNARAIKRGRDTWKAFGLTLELFTETLLKQKHRCAICKRKLTARGSEESKELKPHADHCHKTLRFRGILCNRCNLNLSIVENWYLPNEAEIKEYLA